MEEYIPLQEISRKIKMGLPLRAIFNTGGEGEFRKMICIANKPSSITRQIYSTKLWENTIDKFYKNKNTTYLVLGGDKPNPMNICGVAKDLWIGKNNTVWISFDLAGNYSGNIVKDLIKADGAFRIRSIGWGQPIGKNFEIDPETYELECFSVDFGEDVW